MLLVAILSVDLACNADLAPLHSHQSAPTGASATLSANSELVDWQERWLEAALATANQLDEALRVLELHSNNPQSAAPALEGWLQASAAKRLDAQRRGKLAADRAPATAQAAIRQALSERLVSLNVGARMEALAPIFAADPALSDLLTQLLAEDL